VRRRWAEALGRIGAEVQGLGRMSPRHQSTSSQLPTSPWCSTPKPADSPSSSGGWAESTAAATPRAAASQLLPPPVAGRSAVIV
jgi:hypothetical protein